MNNNQTEPQEQDSHGTKEVQEEVSQGLTQRLLHEAKAFKTSIADKADFFSLPYHYIVSLNWLTCWKNYVSYDQLNADGFPLSKDFGRARLPVLNEDLLDPKAKFTFKFPQEQDHLNHRIDISKRQGVDYIFVNKDTWKLFDHYDSVPLKRFVVKGLDGPVVEVHYIKVTYFPLSPSALKDIEHERTTKMLESTFQVSRFHTVGQINDICKDAWAKTIEGTNTKSSYYAYSYAYPVYWEENKPVKVWKLPQNTQKPIFLNTLRLGCKSNPSFGYKLYIPGTLLAPQTPFSDCDITDTTYLVAEMQEKKEAWCFFSKTHPLDGSCSYCKLTKTLTYLCSCKYAAYCCPRCKQDDKVHHKFRCPNEAQSSDEEGEKKGETMKSRQGLTGLKNLGNTCFMNSALQCLSHVPQLTAYFLSGKYVNEINKENKLGTRGELSTNYAKLIKAVWWGEDASVSPALLKKAIGIYQPMFSGYNQHDSGQLITYLLDGLHEDLNRIKEKPYVEIPDAAGRDDKIVAEEVWNGFLKRNRSIIVDLMYGQYKSVLDCPKCAYRSVQFDPFLLCSLPIKNNNAKKIEITFIINHIYTKKVTIMFQQEWQWTMKDVENKLKSVVGLAEGGREIIFYVASYTSCSLISKTKEAKVVRKEYEYQTIYARELLQNQDPENDLKILLSSTAHHSHYSHDQTYRRSILQFRIYFVKKQMTNKEVHKLFFSYYQQHSQIKNYEQQVINVEKKEQVWRLLTQPTTHYYSCEYCKTKGCYGCELPYDDESFAERVEGALTREKRVQMEIFWRKDAKELQRRIEDSKEVFDKLSRTSEPTVSKDDASVYECLKLFSEPQILQENNEWYCPKCADFVLAKKQMQIYRAPAILVLCLKRFKRKGEYYQEKYNILVDFPLKGLDMSEYVVDHSLPTSDIQHPPHHGNLLYDLIGVSNHFGSTGGGHYTAFCKDPRTEKWYDFDDSSVDQLRSDREVITESAYILFYKRRTPQ